jgi:hypothetical protein
MRGEALPCLGLLPAIHFPAIKIDHRAGSRRRAAIDVIERSTPLHTVDRA